MHRGIVTSILRFVAFSRFKGIGPEADGTWANSALAIYSIAEGGVYLMAACIPSYRSLYLIIRRSRPHKSGETGLDSNYTWRNKSYAAVEEAEIPLSRYVRTQDVASGPDNQFSRVQIPSGGQRSI